VYLRAEALQLVAAAAMFTTLPYSLPYFAFAFCAENYAYYTFRRPNSSFPVMGLEVGGTLIEDDDAFAVLCAPPPELDKSIIASALA
jgi:hypothetical protein